MGTGTDTIQQPTHTDSLLAGIRHLTALADGAADTDAMFRALARELLSVPGAEEVHIHHLEPDGASEDELVAVYLHGGTDRLSYLHPRTERPPGVSWVASTRNSFLATDTEGLEVSIPRLTETGVVTGALLVPLAERERSRRSSCSCAGNQRPSHQQKSSSPSRSSIRPPLRARSRARERRPARTR